jgi:hypothetical protein
MEREQGLGSIRSKNDIHWFFVIFIIYVLVLIAFFVLSLEHQPFYTTIPKSGLIVGAFFPLISFAYYHQHYLKVQGLEDLRPSILSWVLPALLTQFIIIVCFIILLPKQDIKNDPKQAYKINYDRSFFSGAFHYGRLFKEFQKVQSDISTKRITYEEIPKLFHYYRPMLESKEAEKSTKAETCPPKENQEEFMAYCLQKFAQMSTAINAIPFYLALSFGFLGALIFSLGDLVIRFNMVDLYPKNFVFYSIRFVVAASLCATLSNFFIEEFPLIVAIPVFFLIGYFPERAIKYLDQKMTEYLGFKTYEPLPLSLVQGMSGEKAFRLRELGIEDVQHLAVSNVQEMKKNLPYSRDMLCDWIAQSLLILYFNKQIAALRDVGVRTILDLQGCLLESPKNEVIKCAKKIGISEIQLRHVTKILATDPMRTRINELKTCLEKECELKT